MLSPVDPPRMQTPALRATFHQVLVTQLWHGPSPDVETQNSDSLRNFDKYSLGVRQYLWFWTVPMIYL